MGGTFSSGSRSNDGAVAVKQDRGDKRLARFLLLLGDHGVEPPNGVRFQPRHRAAAIENKNQFCHYEYPPVFVCVLIIPNTKEDLVAWKATYFKLRFFLHDFQVLRRGRTTLSAHAGVQQGPKICGELVCSCCLYVGADAHIGP